MASFWGRLIRMRPPRANSLETLHRLGLRLPDECQPLVDGVYARPDFLYAEHIAVFCDGSHHRQEWIKEKDEVKRDSLRERGWEVLVWRYDEDLEAWFGKRSDIFKKVKS